MFLSQALRLASKPDACLPAAGFASGISANPVHHSVNPCSCRPAHDCPQSWTTRAPPSSGILILGRPLLKSNSARILRGDDRGGHGWRRRGETAARASKRILSRVHFPTAIVVDCRRRARRLRCGGGPVAQGCAFAAPPSRGSFDVPGRTARSKSRILHDRMDLQRHSNLPPTRAPIQRQHRPS